MKPKIMTILMLFLSFSFAQAQDRNVTGKVTDASDGSPIPGAYVKLVGTTIAVLTDFDGTYSISIPEGTDNAQLEFSFLGYQTAIKNVTSDNINAALAAETTDIGEVVVIGYGTQKKSDKTGSVYSVSDEDIQTVGIQDPIEGIQGKVAGVTIRKAGSDPNAGFDVKIRGASGLISNTNPLYVVDGVVGVDPTTIAPEDIASFNVLKDASSAAIYGSRGANGVVIITTKQGKEGSTKIELNNYVTFDQISPQSKLDLMTADEFRAYGKEKGYTIRDLGASTDWQDEIYRNALTYNTSVAFSGGNENSTYRASLAHNDMQGIVLNSGKTRSIMRINATSNAFNDKLALSMNLSNTVEHNDYVNYGSSGADGVLYQAFQRNPTSPVYEPDGVTYFQDPTPPVNNYSNPVAVLNDIQNQRDAKRVLGNLKAELEVIQGLKLTVKGSYTRDDNENFYFEPSSNGPLNGEGRASREYSNTTTMLGETFLNFDKQLGDHNMQLVGGYSYQQFDWDGFRAGGLDPASDFTQAHDLASLANVQPGDVDSWKGQNRLISSFARVAYNFGYRYYITATIRRDGSSVFGANKEWGIFPSGSVAWNIKNESFMQNIEFLSLAKLRVGYGQTGNQDIAAYKNIALFGVTGYTLDPETNKYTVNYGALQNPNTELQWEVNTEINYGLDFGLLSDKFTGSFDYYMKTTSDLLYNYSVTVPPNLVDNTLANGGAIDITGMEGVLTWHVFDDKKFKWSTTFVATHDKAIVSKLSSDQFLPISKVQEGWLQEPLGYGNATQIMKEGMERGTFWGPKFAGIDANSGSFLYEKNDGSFRTIDFITADDYKELGTAQPHLELGWNNSLTIAEDIDINFTVRGLFGHDILNATNMVFDNPSYFPTRNVLSTAPERSELTEASTFSDYFLEKGNFVRLENFTIGYNLNKFTSKWASRARVYVSGNNLLTFTNYSGIDPSTIGIDLFNVYPKSRSVTVGFNLTF